ncbi:MAG: hypothetical protein J0I32_08910 [Sphingobacteriales bacterium]|nr:hypothetical protein [Sphingobacteriales bacterium]OJW00119.1 MAG: hypothetical protein BGO52_03255 [Sphingobacteriales bacterium 44-61]
MDGRVIAFGTLPNCKRVGKMSKTITDLIFEVFITMEDHLDWDKHITYAELSEQIDDDSRQQWISALQFLRLEFGDDFLRLNNSHHPIFRMVTDKSPWRIAEIIKFAVTLIQLKSTDINYRHLKDKLIHPGSCKTEGIPFFEISHMYLDTGCDVKVWKDIKAQKNPDLVIGFPETNEKLYIEVSKVGESKLRSDLDNNFKVISRLFNIAPPQLPFSCQLLRYISDSEMDGVLASITAIREKALLQQDMILLENEVMRLCVTHPNKYGQFQEWMEKNDYRNGLHGPPLNFDETYRILNYKIEREMEQIPAGSSGMIYLHVHALYFSVIDPEIITAAFEKKMSTYPLLFGIVIYSTIITDCSPFEVAINGHFFSTRKINETVVRYFFFLKNPAYSHGLSDNAIARIYQSFRSSSGN